MDDAAKVERLTKLDELRAISDELWEAHAQGDISRISDAIYELRETHRRLAAQPATQGQGPLQVTREEWDAYETLWAAEEVSGDRRFHLNQVLAARTPEPAQGAVVCNHEGIGQPMCTICDPRTRREGGPQCDQCQAYRDEMKRLGADVERWKKAHDARWPGCDDGEDVFEVCAGRDAAVLALRDARAELEAANRRCRKLVDETGFDAARAEQAEAALAALRNTATAVLDVLGDTRWNPVGDMAAWARTEQGSNHSCVAAAMESLRMALAATSKAEAGKREPVARNLYKASEDAATGELIYVRKTPEALAAEGSPAQPTPASLEALSERLDAVPGWTETRAIRTLLQSEKAALHKRLNRHERALRVLVKQMYPASADRWWAVLDGIELSGKEGGSDV